MTSQATDISEFSSTRISGLVAKIRQIGFGRWLYEAWRRHVVLPVLTKPYIPLPGSEPLLAWFKNRKGLEIGGPSRIFDRNGHLPLYPLIAVLDNCNFSTETVWEGELANGPFTIGDRLMGQQMICEATEIANHVERESYDFLISSNCLEHVANPMAALDGWISVLRPGGKIIVVVPNQRHNFDHRRPVTTFEHVMSDYHNNVGEDDATHFEEVLALTDRTLQSRSHVPSSEAFRQQVLNNPQKRCVHHHVFDSELLKSMAAHFGLEEVRVMDARTEFILFARRPD